MTWFGWVLVAMWSLNPFIVVYRLGKPREPYDNGDAAAAILVSALLIIGALSVGTGAL